MTINPTALDARNEIDGALSDAKMLLAAMDHLVEFLIDDDYPIRGPLLGVLHAAKDKIDAAEKAIEAVAAPQDKPDKIR